MSIRVPFRSGTTIPGTVFSLALLTFGLISATESKACFATPQEQIVSKEKLVSRTKTIVLAQAVKAELQEDGTVKYTFRQIKNIKGEAPKEFVIIGQVSDIETDLETFDDHRKPSFWESGGRSHHDTDCEIHPTFSVGLFYLIFLEQPYHQKSFERIVRLDPDQKDEWLTWVEENS
jgi:hypothetical protein